MGFKKVLRTSGAWSPSRRGCWKTQWSSRFRRSVAAGWRSGWTGASWNISTASPTSLACPVHTDTKCFSKIAHAGISTKQNITSQITTDLLDLVLLHEGQELEKEAGQAEEEVNELMDEERPPGGDLKLGVIVQHVAPGMFQRGLEGVLRQGSVHVLHSQVGRGQDVGCSVHLHDGRRGREEASCVERRLRKKNTASHDRLQATEAKARGQLVLRMCCQASKFKSVCLQLLLLKHHYLCVFNVWCLFVQVF